MPRLRAVSISPPQPFWTFEFNGRQAPHTAMEVFGPLYAVAMVEDKPAEHGEDTTWHFVTMGDVDGRVFERNECFRSLELAKEAARDRGAEIAYNWRQGNQDVPDFPVVVREIHE